MQRRSIRNVGAAAGVDGRLAGLADNNTTADAVGYFNLRPFLHGSKSSTLRVLNIGASLAGGEFTHPAELLPLRTSLESTKNDEAAVAASATFLKFDEEVRGVGDWLQGAVHLAWYYR